MSDITAGPDMFSRILAANHDEDNADIGETSKSWLEVASEKLVAARLEARKRVLKGKGKAVKITHVLTITETVTPGNGDKVRLEEPSFEFVSKMSKPAPIKGRGAWVDSEGNQIGRVEMQMGFVVVEGEKSTAKAEKRKAM